MREDLMQFSSEEDDDEVFCDGNPSTSSHKRKADKAIGSPPSNQVFASRCISPDSRGELTILERIIRSHPIWYIPELSRVAAAHLLRQHEVGAFIVRQASKIGAMALSIRLPHFAPQELDHYLIETTIGAGVHLEGSQHFFPALPVLLAYYCENSGELQVQLRLPAAIMSCKARSELNSLALLGQDFWISEVSKGGHDETNAVLSSGSNGENFGNPLNPAILNPTTLNSMNLAARAVSPRYVPFPFAPGIPRSASVSNSFGSHESQPSIAIASNSQKSRVPKSQSANEKFGQKFSDEFQQKESQIAVAYENKALEIDQQERRNFRDVQKFFDGVSNRKATSATNTPTTVESRK